MGFDYTPQTGIEIIELLEAVADGSKLNFVNLDGYAAAKKDSTQSVRNSTTLVSVTDMVFAIGANENWVYMFQLPYGGGSGNSDIKYNIAVPSGAQDNRVHGWVDTVGNPVWNYSSDGSSCGHGISGVRCAIIIGIVQNSTTAGNVQLQMAQVVAEDIDTYTYANSWYVAWRVN